MKPTAKQRRDKCVFPHIRRKLHTLLLKNWVSPGISTVVQAQRLRHHALDAYFKKTAVVGHEIFYATALPCLYFMGYHALGRHLSFLSAYAGWIIGFVKDALCLPRPSHPKLVRLEKGYDHECGFVSSHTAQAAVFSLFTFLFFTLGDHSSLASFPSIFSFLQSNLFSAVFALWYFCTIAFGRLYLGMHYPADLIGGWVIGVSLASLWWLFSASIDTFLLTNPWAPFIQFWLGAALIRLHPMPPMPTPTIEDSTAHMAVAWGVCLSQSLWANILPPHPSALVSLWAAFSQPSFSFNFAFEVTKSFSLLVTQVAVGLICFFVAKEATKRLCLLVSNFVLVKVLHKSPVVYGRPAHSNKKTDRDEQTFASPPPKKHQPDFEFVSDELPSQGETIIRYLSYGVAASVVAGPVFPLFDWLGFY